MQRYIILIRFDHGDQILHIFEYKLTFILKDL